VSQRANNQAEVNMAEEQQTPGQQPVLPPQPWYTSPVQVQLVAAGVTQFISIVFRTIDLLGFELQLQKLDVDAIGANVAQGLVLVFVAIAWWKRQRSQVAPLTMTQKRADDLTKMNPPVLSADPTKVPK
jgi:hypothetical protein